MLTMRGGDADKKKAAMDYLSKFQKSVSNLSVLSLFYLSLGVYLVGDPYSHFSQTDAWTTTIAILQSPAEADAQLFAATTLKGKVCLEGRS